jgi:hypothetical protein
MPNHGERTYRVGYGRPPKETQFKKGQSGNPKGRRKGSKSFLSLLAEAFDQRVWANDGGERKSISKREAFATQFVNKGAAGGIRAAKLLFEWIRQIETESALAEQQGGQRASGDARERIMRRLEEIAQRQAKFEQIGVVKKSA